MATYLDHAATTPMPPEVIAAYAEALAVVGNPSSIHTQGQAARGMLEEARESIAEALGAEPVEVTFTSGGTESINLAIKGLWWSRSADGGPRRILATRAEHHATLDAIEWLERHEGASVRWLGVDAHARLGPDAVREALNGDPDVALLTTLAANNEVGTIQPLELLAAEAREHAVPVHVDAVGALGRMPLDFHGIGAAAMSVSAHKVGGPVGVGALLVRRGVEPTPLVHGGSQQAARSGTLDAAGAVAFAVALERAERLRRDRLDELDERGRRLAAGIAAVVPDARLRGHPLERLPGTVNVTFPGSAGDAMLFLLDQAGFSVSTGSACRAGVAEASHVLLAMGLDEAAASSALRFSLGFETTDAEVDALLAVLPEVVERARSASAG